MARNKIFKRWGKRLRQSVWLQRKAWHQRFNPRSPSQLPLTILVPGVQRSGTNMIMKVLERSWQTDVYHETDPRAFDFYHLRPMAILKRLRSNSQAPFVVIKALLDSHMVSELKSVLAPVRVLWSYRHYDDMVNSNLISWPGGRNQIEELISDPYQTGYRVRGMTAETMALVRTHYQPGMNDASAIALFWYYRNQLLFDQSLDRDPDTLLLRYEDIVTEPTETIKGLCAWLGLTFDPNMASAIHARSVGKRPPPDLLPDIRNLCQSMLERLDTARQRSISLTGPGA